MLINSTREKITESLRFIGMYLHIHIYIYIHVYVYDYDFMYSKRDREIERVQDSCKTNLCYNPTGTFQKHVEMLHVKHIAACRSSKGSKTSYFLGRSQKAWWVDLQGASLPLATSPAGDLRQKSAPESPGRNSWVTKLGGGSSKNSTKKFKGGRFVVKLWEV